MADELNQDPSLKAWLDGLKKDVEERKAQVEEKCRDFNIINSLTRLRR